MKHEMNVEVYSTGSKWCAMLKEDDLDSPLSGFGTTVAAALRDLARNIEGKSKERKVSKAIASLPDEEWIESLRGNPAYEGIDIRKEFGKCNAWCQAQGKTVSRMRFVNWLNRVRPVRVGMANTGQVRGEYDYSKYRQG